MIGAKLEHYDCRDCVFFTGIYRMICEGVPNLCRIPDDPEVKASYNCGMCGKFQLDPRAIER